MSNSDLILELLEETYPNTYCDDCLSRELNISPRQQVNQICRGLENQDRITRTSKICSSCGKTKICNSTGMDVSSEVKTQKPSQDHFADYRKAEEMPTIVPSTPIGKINDIDIVKLRNEIVRICHQIWDKNKSDKPPHSISMVISNLRADSFIPALQANMMLTLCSLRNVYVYESVHLGSRELTIAGIAWDIISEWWDDFNNCS